MKRSISFGLVGALALMALVSFSPSATAADEVKAKAVAVDPSRLGADLQGVAKLVESGVDEAVVVAFIEKNPLQRSPTADELVYLQSAGLSSKVMVALMNSVKKPAPAAVVQTAPVQATATTPSVAYAPTTPPVVYVNRPYVDYVPYPSYSFGWDVGHHIFDLHGFSHGGGHGGGHHGGGHH